MEKLYFKDVNGEFHPISLEHLELRPNSLVMIQLEDEAVTVDKLESLLQIVENISKDREIKNIDFVVLSSKVRIEILDRDKDLCNKEILIDVESLNEKQQQEAKMIFRENLKKFHYEFVRLPIRGDEGNA